MYLTETPCSRTDIPSKSFMVLSNWQITPRTARSTTSFNGGMDTGMREAKLQKDLAQEREYTQRLKLRVSVDFIPMPKHTV